MKTLKELKDELDNFDSSINQHIQNLDDKFNEKWEKKFNEQLSQIQQMKNNSNLSNIPINNIRNNNIQNNNIQNINIINNNDNNDYNDNYDINDINNINDNNNNDNNQIFEDYENLRKQKINFDNINNPPLIKLLFIDDTNPLVNLVLQCISNIKTLVLYYFNPKKEEKILLKANNDPNNCYLGPSFLKLLDHLWKSNQKEYDTTEMF